MFYARGWAAALSAAVVSTAACASGARDTGRAASPQAAEVIRTFEGRGVMADGSSPTPPAEARRRFRLPAGMAIETVAAEPQVSQPLFVTWDSRGRLWVVQYRQYQFPAGLRIVEYDDHLRAQFDRVPEPPPHGPRGRDVVSVFEDRDGDGRHDTRKDVLTGLNIATAVAVGHDGLWVANPPYLLFYSDADGDDVPDGEPEVKLAGFGLEDTHAVMNNLTWGPDGWLYGATGSTTTARVIDPASGQPVAWQGQAIWRYHPPTTRFEIYAEGGGNTFSLEIDAVGHVFSGTNTGRTRGMFYPQGSYGPKAWGKHGPLTNPYAFGHVDHMRHTGDDRRFPQAFAIYEDALFPAAYAGRILAPNSLHNLVWVSRLERDGSTWRTVDEAPLVETDDHWFRPVHAAVGPDGALYLADWYDSRLSHVSPVDDWHKASGRIYRVLPEGTAPRYDAGDLSRAPLSHLVQTLAHPSRAVRRRAVLEIGWRGDRSVVPDLTRLVETGAPQQALEALWALHLLDALPDDAAMRWLDHASPHVRRWVVRLVGDRRTVSPGLGARLAARARVEPDVQVRVQLAASAARLPAEAALPIVEGLFAHDTDLDDPHQPLMLWWAVERQAAAAPECVAAWIADARPWQQPLFRDVVAPRLMRRHGIQGRPGDLQRADALLAGAPDAATRAALLDALGAAFEGVARPSLPPTLARALDAHAAAQGEPPLVRRLQAGDPAAVGEARAAIVDRALTTSARTALIRALGAREDAADVPALLRVLALDQASAEQRVALQVLAGFDRPALAGDILQRYGSTLPDEHGVKDTALRVLAGRPAWADALLDAVERAVVKARDVPPDVVTLLLSHGDAARTSRVARLWPRTTAVAGADDIVATTARLRRALAGAEGNAERGAAVYERRCGACHVLFGSGGQVGPDLTGYARHDVAFWVPAIVAPGLEVREGYEQFVATFADGRTLAGVLVDQTPRTVTLRDAAGEAHVIERGRLATLEASPISPMPPGLLDDLDDRALRDLFAYLMQPAPAPAPAPSGEPSSPVPPR